MIEPRSNFSRRMLIRLIVLGTIVGIILLANYQFISELYLKNQMTPVGLIVNGGILLIFLLGLVKIVATLSYYMQEEIALARFVRQFSSDPEKLMKGVSPKSVIARRHNTIRKLSEEHARINHSALAATLAADEHTRISFTRYVSNILILTGVFGTIVSLSVALMGTSNLLDSAQDSGSMGLVIHGMSTALSTTITAILCYLFYGYFYLKLSDAQIHFLSGVEEVTSVYLLPEYSHDSESMLHEVAGLIHGLREAASGMRNIQLEYAEAGNRLHVIAADLGEQMNGMTRSVDGIKELLREGFRLPATGD
ncbi:MAG: MotA/TolQ/ExbB proton channel family protein [Gammaproteobacteria bacterium]|nr:MotA/TolQ/ExbB proton channel family protein [Gammaproteobacteria bacterium]